MVEVQVAPFYVNRFYVTSGQDEFYILLKRVSPEGERINPYQAKGLRDALSQIISEYEETYGKIPEMEIGRADAEEPSFKPKAEARSPEVA